MIDALYIELPGPIFRLEMFIFHFANGLAVAFCVNLN